ncbi:MULTISPECIES: ATP-binding protein [Hallerella]|uniref:sensor histidine kinase n=1 Tax=Hallerella TaxID=2815788 RepID=UPI00258E30CE|nr:MULTISPECIES: ATP-binding protein [Hallerella]MCI6874540.1 ATP-binding protein [Hallerella sp.]MDY5028561.1 ATP-binding protein [Hallerella succinigenes]
MKNSLRFSLIYVGVLAALFAVYFTSQVFEKEMTEQLKGDLRETAHIVALAYENAESLAPYASDSLRITLIDEPGNVLFESNAETAQMENHKNRPEVMEAFAKGFGEDFRYSVTSNANEFYCAIRLKDGMVLRLSRQQASLHEAFSETMPYLLALLLAIVLAAILLAFGLGRAFVRPVQKLAQNLGQPELMDDEGIYPEIAPLVKTIREQNRELQNTVEQLSNEKLKTVQMRDEFTANASHELKTPLTSISGYAELIESGIAKPEDIKDFAGKIHKEANRLLSIANDIMTLSKLDAPNASLDLKESVNLEKIALNCIEELSLNAKKKKVPVSLKVEEASEIQGNSRLLFEMFYNLIDNAIRYTEEDGNVQVLVRNKTFTVKDTGIGIPEENQPRIFERFYRVDKSRSKATGGTGLGLAIVKHIAEVHGAKIVLHSTVGVGTEIRVEFR